MSGCGSLKVCGWLAGASVRAARCGLVQSGRAACAQPVPRMRSSTESYPARHRPRREFRWVRRGVGGKLGNKIKPHARTPVCALRFCRAWCEIRGWAGGVVPKLRAPHVPRGRVDGSPSGQGLGLNAPASLAQGRVVVTPSLEGGSLRFPV